MTEDIKITEPVVCRCRENLTFKRDVELFSLAECPHGNRWVYVPLGKTTGLWERYHGPLRSWMTWIDARSAGVRLPR